MAKQIRIAQISDLHIKPPGELAYGRVDTAKALERCIAALSEFAPAPDFVVISGDLADAPSVEEYDHLKRLLKPLQLPFASSDSDLVCWLCGSSAVTVGNPSGWTWLAVWAYVQGPLTDLASTFSDSSTSGQT